MEIICVDPSNTGIVAVVTLVECPNNGARKFNINRVIITEEMLQVTCIHDQQYTRETRLTNLFMRLVATPLVNGYRTSADT